MIVNVSKIKNIPGKTMNVELAVSPSYLPMEGEKIKLVSPLKFSGKMENLGDRLFLTGEIEATVELLCSRCAEAISFSVQAPFSELFTNRRSVAKEEQDEEITFFAGEEIDITSHAARAILLELPMKILCRDDCRGLCPECGVNLNQAECHCAEESIDPRFQALKKLVQPSSTEGGVKSGSTKEENI
jgi:uncharacterized protein